MAMIFNPSHHSEASPESPKNGRGPAGQNRSSRHSTAPPRSAIPSLGQICSVKNGDDQGPSYYLDMLMNGRGTCSVRYLADAERHSMAKLSRSDIERQLSAASFADKLYDIHDTRRAACPVYWSDSSPRRLGAACHLVDEVPRDLGRFSCEGAEAGYIVRLRGDSARATRRSREHFGWARLNGTDLPDYARIRREFGRSRLPRTVESYASEIEHSAAAIIKRASPLHDTIDVVGDFAEPPPVDVLVVSGSWCTQNELVRAVEDWRERNA